MTNDDEQLLADFSELLQELLGETGIRLSATTRRQDVAGWDSFNYVNFIVAVEMRHAVKFRVADVESFGNVGEIVAAVQRMKSAKGRG